GGVVHDPGQQRELSVAFYFFFLQAGDGIRVRNVTGVQTCALPIFGGAMLHMDIVLLHSGVVCCTSTFSCYIRERYVAHGHRLATFGGGMLHVDLLLLHSGELCCTWTPSCNFRGRYVARGHRLATFGGGMLRFDILLRSLEPS